MRSTRRVGALHVRALLVALAALPSACESTRDAIDISRSANGIETVRFGDRAVAGQRALRPVLGVRIGTLDGPAELAFGAPVPRLLSDGRIVIADLIASEVRLFDADGTYRSGFGAAGEGPGEFRRLANLFVTSGDSILTYDAGNRRVSVFTFDGEFARSYVLAAPEATFAPSAYGDSYLLGTNTDLLGVPVVELWHIEEEP